MNVERSGGCVAPDRSLEMRRRLFGDRNALVAQSRNNLATCLWDQERYDEAKTLLREAIETMRSLRGSEHVDVGSGLSNLARLEADMGNLETAEKLFDIHNRGSGDGVTHGAGLGLAIARQLARRMGGDITARSPGPGQGAVFTVSLAVAPPQLAGAEAAHG